jgi:pimeloyl-ACP methyl ester carboxylesterase
VEDLEALRQKLGLDTICLYGYSHGSLIAQAYARQFPSHVATSSRSGHARLNGPEMYVDQELPRQDPDLWEQIQLLIVAKRVAADPEMEKLSRSICEQFCE